MSETKHTPGPWFPDTAGHIWRRPPADLYENGGGVAGDKPLATVNKGWYRENEQGYPVEANASLIAAAPELLKALQRLSDQCSRLRLPGQRMTDAERNALEVLAKAEGRK